MLTLPEFVTRWKASTLSERSAYQQHFLDLCDLLGQKSPAEVDQSGATYTFEKGVAKTTGGSGFADVWMRGHFGWEYKGKHKDLSAAYQQLLQYREHLENPPLLVVCDLDRFEVHSNFTNTVPKVYAFDLDALLQNKPTPTCSLPPLDVLRFLFEDPSRLRPEQTSAQVTEKAAAKFGLLAQSLSQRGVPSEPAARFLMRLLFCLFAEDIGLLPPRLFSRLVDANRLKPAEFSKKLRQLFAAMASEHGAFGEHDIAWFNGGLFMDDLAYDLTVNDLATLSDAAALNWASIEPAIFGTLFERGLDPGKRAQLGAHYTSKEDILLIIEPVLMAPLYRKWSEVKAKAQPLITKSRDSKGAIATKARKAFTELLRGFISELARVRVLDPACGSGNFLYLALKRLLDLEKEVSVFATENGLTGLLPQTDPRQLYGIETNTYAHELASVVVWIGYIQWLHDNGFGIPQAPILQRLDNIKLMDAILTHDTNGKPAEPEWPEADAIIGNPPFLGDKKMREGLGDKYVGDLRALYADRVPGGADLVTYWHERAREQISSNRSKRAGLLATNAIRRGANRKILEAIKRSGDIFMAWSDRPWILDGANVRVSMIGFDNGTETHRTLEGAPIQEINCDLTAAADIAGALPLKENAGLCFLGMMKGGPFDIDAEVAHKMLSAPANINGRPNSDVVRLRLGGQEITGRPRDVWIIDFDEMPQANAAQYEAPFEYVRAHVKPVRDKSRDALMHKNWWLHGRSRPALRNALVNKTRCIVTPEVAKHRLFVWMPTSSVPDHTLHVIARDDDYFFGVVQSGVHNLWSLRTGSTLEDRPRYTATRTFETFPFPWPPGDEPKNDERVEEIAQAALDLLFKRAAWLNPAGASDAELKKRTLTNLYNQRPQWLQDAHRILDEAVLKAYGWPTNLSNDEILHRLLALNLDRANGQARATMQGPKGK